MLSSTHILCLFSFLHIIIWLCRIHFKITIKECRLNIKIRNRRESLIKVNTLFCEYYFATNMALYFCMIPSSWYFILNIHSNPIIVLHPERSTKSQVLFFLISIRSSSIARLHSIFVEAFLKLAGSALNKANMFHK